MVRAYTDLELAEQQLREAERDRAYYSTQLGKIENRNGIIATYTKKGLNYRNAEILALKRRVASLLPPAPDQEVKYHLPPSYNKKPVKEMAPPGLNASAKAMAVPSIKNGNNNMKEKAPSNNNNMSNPLNRINSTLFKRAKFSRRNRRSTRKNRRSTRKN